MANIVSTVRIILNKRWKYSSSITKSAISAFNGRSASIFRISTYYSVNP
ncbi:hypothetical protein SAMN05421842_1129 [Clostridium uliginosum]|uniref:Uncharacterized protein n=1 Tax=Clostridium uliginosum TaxID=119641 RepID=A0A1I1MRR1_9CLOT|nr:hypothetical protein SAMN05421842_1129 [Clostridium uliginosum]